MQKDKEKIEDLQRKLFVSELSNQALTGCLVYCKNQIKEIKEFAEKNSFVGDMFVLGTVNNVLACIENLKYE